jgi:DNA-binding MarR family transcriptional regulator
MPRLSTGPLAAAEQEPATTPAEQVGQAFKGATGAVRRLRGRETHRPGELSHAQFSLLFGLAKGGALSARELACAADLSPATVTPMLDHLAAAGLVERIRSEDDKRIVITSLTDLGREVVEQRRTQYELRWGAALAEFSEDELLIAAAVLDRLATLFDEFHDI